MKSLALRICVCIALSPLAANAADKCNYTEEWSLPEWFTQSNPIPASYRVSCRLNPFYLRGDFDGDGRQDLAVLIANVKSGKSGIAVILRTTGSTVILGAGVPLNDDDDNFSWLDVWRVDPGPASENVSSEALPKFRGETLYLEKSESASGWAGLVGDRFVWYQGGD